MDSRPTQRAHAGKLEHSVGTHDVPIRPLSIAIDPIAEAALRSERARAPETELRCDACDESVDPEAAGRGLYMWTRGEEVRFEEPVLCERCATAIGVTALRQFTVEEEEG